MAAMRKSRHLNDESPVRGWLRAMWLSPLPPKTYAAIVIFQIASAVGIVYQLVQLHYANVLGLILVGSLCALILTGQIRTRRDDPS
jgi:hypothetical protein